MESLLKSSPILSYYNFFKRRKEKANKYNLSTFGGLDDRVETVHVVGQVMNKRPDGGCASAYGDVFHFGTDLCSPPKSLERLEKCTCSTEVVCNMLLLLVRNIAEKYVMYLLARDRKTKFNARILQDCRFT